MLEFLRKHPERFRPWVADDVQTRQLKLLNEHRRQLVDNRTALTNCLTTLLKGCFPEALRWAEDLRTPRAWDFLAQFLSLERPQQASRLAVGNVYRAHTRRTPSNSRPPATRFAPPARSPPTAPSSPVRC